MIRALVLVVLAPLIASCATRYVPINYYHNTESVKVERDSTHYIDTIRIAERGDTVRVEVTKWRTQYKTHTDTLLRIDTLQLPPQLTAPRIEEKRGKKPFLLVLSFLSLSLVAGFAVWEFKK